MRPLLRAAVVAVLPLAWLVAYGGASRAGAPSPTPPAVASSTGAPVGSLRIDLAKREAARNFYRTIYASSVGVASGFTGNVEAGSAGTTSREFRDAIARRVNYFRAMAGVPADVLFDDELSRKAQLAALMMAANGQLSHSPPRTWRHYSDDGALAASKSNLNLADGPGAIDGYMEDFGASNGAAGHRRWALYSRAGVMGTGDVDAQGSTSAANALWVVNSSAERGNPKLRDGFIAWPPPGFVPAPLVYPRWSFALPSASFEKAVVTMTGPGGASLPVRVEPLKGGFADDAIVWVPEGWEAASGGRPATTGADQSYHVAIDRVLVGGASKRFEYDVKLFQPDLPGADAVTPTVRGAAVTSVGAASPYAFDAVPGADGYVWEDAALSPMALDDGAEGGAGGFAATISPGYAPTSSDHAASGASAFHLAMPSATPQTLTLTRAFLCAKGTTLSFQSRLRLATAAQRPRVQVAIDGDTSWSELWAQPAATGTTDEKSFAPVQLSLAPFAGRVVRVRFVYDHAGSGSYFPQTKGAGWYFDDVRLRDAEEPRAALGHPIDGTTFSFVARAPGRTALRVRPRFYGRYLLDWGPVTVVEARGAGAPLPTTPPTAVPTSAPTVVATGTPTAVPTSAPTGTTRPTFPFPVPTTLPTLPWPTTLPTGMPTTVPTGMPTTLPTSLPLPIPIPSVFRIPPPPWGA